ncbi:MAG: glutathione S-transferase [Alphaproteobacteria bacterium HGW-Alphaproteobacteria-6]|nr:MAG: glutathione S-transferase [Alphaproteobacteria bacterium HGW-Alphaproteobacteria-6]
MTARLHCFGESGNAYKAALTMTLAGYDWRPVFVDFFGGATRSPEFRALNIMGEVPVLEDAGRVITQSGAIMYHVVQETGRFGGAPGEAAEVLRWVLWDNHKMSSQAGPLRFMMNFLAADKRPEAVIAWLAGRLRGAFAALDAHLAGRDWIVGDGVTIADLSCCGYLYYPEPFGFARAEWPNIDRWLGNIAALPGWMHPYDLMPGNPAERAGAEDPT